MMDKLNSIIYLSAIVGSGVCFGLWQNSFNAGLFISLTLVCMAYMAYMLLERG